MGNIESSSFSDVSRAHYADAFWAQYLVLDEQIPDSSLKHSPAVVQAAAILVLANVLDNRLKGN